MKGRLFAAPWATHGGCFVTENPTHAERGVRHWRPSCAAWYYRIQKLREYQADPGEAPWVRVVIRDVNLPAKRITVSHEAIPQINMPAMTISLPVADKAYLAMVHKGDEAEIQCEHRGGTVTVTNFRR